MLWYVIPIILIFLVVVFVLNLQILFHYEYPEDGQSYQGMAAKVTALIGLELVWLMLCLVPTDGFNARFNGGLQMDLFWAITLLFIMLYMIVPIPLATAFYEADTDKRVSKIPPWRQSLMPTVIVIAIFVPVYVCMYFALRSTKVMECDAKTKVCNLVDFKTPFLVSSAILIGFFGWVFVTLFLGVGLIAVPQGLILGFIDRPQPISQQDYMCAKKKIEEEIIALKMIGESLMQREEQLKLMPTSVTKWNTQRALKRQVNRFKQSVHLLEKMFAALNVAGKEKGENPFVSYLKLVGGIVSTFLSFIWFLHFVLYIMLPPLINQQIMGGFLNGFFEAVSSIQFYGLDLIIYMLLIGYLMLCQMIGCFRFNLRMFFCFSIHPMKKGETRGSSILFNTSMILVSVHGMAHLSYVAFRGYCKGSFADRLYGEYAAHTPIFGLVYRHNIFIWILVIWICVSLIFFALQPREKIAFDLNRIKKMKITNKPKEGKEGEQAQGKEGGVLKDVDDAAESAMGKFEKCFKFF